MKKRLMDALEDAVRPLGIEGSSIKLEYADDPSRGDFSTNAALVAAKAAKMPPKALAEKIVAGFDKDRPDFIEKVEIAGPGFINFKFKDEALARAALDMAAGKKPKSIGRKVMIEYTDPNICKVFHIGHLMANAIGESLSRLIERSEGAVIRACYPSDVGLNVAKTVAAILKEDKAYMPAESAEPRVKAAYLGKMYVAGTRAYDSGPDGAAFVADVNGKIFARTDGDVSAVYDTCRRWSLEYFETIYKRLDTKFDVTIYESDVAGPGMKVVREFLEKGVFDESQGAVVFRGERRGLHTRVFITSQGLPTYESKEIGLNIKKFELYPGLDESIVVTANEQDDYFKVLLKALSLIRPDVAEKTRHLSHGLLRKAGGKMSSRTGEVVAAEDLIDEMRELVENKAADRGLSSDDVDAIAMAAIKYTILRQGIGGDVIFDSAKSISFEGDSGPYLQYSAVRANSVLEKAGKKDVAVKEFPDKAGPLEGLLIRFPDVIERARAEYAPQVVANYLTALASTFNSFYARNIIVDEKEPLSPYRIALTRVFRAVMTDGLWLLGIKVPGKM